MITMIINIIVHLDDFEIIEAYPKKQKSYTLPCESLCIIKLFQRKRLDILGTLERNPPTEQWSNKSKKMVSVLSDVSDFLKDIST